MQKALGTSFSLTTWQLPFPEANPWKPSKRYRALQLVGQLLSYLNSKKEEKE